ncbi:MAG TPA: hypothetical protein VFI90_18130, partial [Rubrobacter sp.]|nr:hypothetical protein [Rubrobacter sp.]
TEAVRRLHDFCSANGIPLEVVNITSKHIEAFPTGQLERLRPERARARFAPLRTFSTRCRRIETVMYVPVA